jgi:hypothetical protein
MIKLGCHFDWVHLYHVWKSEDQCFLAPVSAASGVAAHYAKMQRILYAERA